jgi:hypothetical protein
MGPLTSAALFIVCLMAMPILAVILYAIWDDYVN